MPFPRSQDTYAQETQSGASSIAKKEDGSPPIIGLQEYSDQIVDDRQTGELLDGRRTSSSR